ncbi:hypothetical protein AAC387_Pa09g0363 [Persea americana]
MASCTQEHHVRSRFTYLNLEVSESLGAAWALPLKGCSVSRVHRSPLHQKPDANWELFISMQERFTAGLFRLSNEEIHWIKKIESSRDSGMGRSIGRRRLKILIICMLLESLF